MCVKCNTFLQVRHYSVCFRFVNESIFCVLFQICEWVNILYAVSDLWMSQYSVCCFRFVNESIFYMLFQICEWVNIPCCLRFMNESIFCVLFQICEWVNILYAVSDLWMSQYSVLSQIYEWVYILCVVSDLWMNLGLENRGCRELRAPLNSPAALSNFCRESKDVLVSVRNISRTF